jgi:hypothetical protein
VLDALDDLAQQACASAEQTDDHAEPQRHTEGGRADPAAGARQVAAEDQPLGRAADCSHEPQQQREAEREGHTQPLDQRCEAEKGDRQGDQDSRDAGQGPPEREPGIGLPAGSRGGGALTSHTRRA